MNTTINFGGFYNSHHEYIIEQAVGYMLGADDPDTGEMDGDILYDFNEWQGVMLSYSKEWLDMLNSELGTELIFNSLDSPREYNFKTDVIIADISEQDHRKLMLFISDNGLVSKVDQHLRDVTTSRDGYHAFYNFEDLFKPEQRDILAQCRLDIIIGFLGENYPFIVEDFYC